MPGIKHRPPKNERISFTPSEASSIPNYAGIYCIRCVVNDEKYVGQASHIKNRINSHLSSLKKNKHSIKRMQGDWNNCGQEGFEIYILCRCTRSELNQNEEHWISKLSAGYNTLKRTMNFAKRELTVDSIDYIPGLELQYVPLKWHKWVYGSGRH